nr:MAG TPA: hypothetical protein [Caudoviricetes sp.]
MTFYKTSYLIIRLTFFRHKLVFIISKVFIAL